MATLQKIRNRGPVIAIVIGFALLAFLLGDFLSSGQALFSNDNMLAEINGTEITLQDYQNRYKNYEQGFKLLTGESNPSEQNQQYVENQVWDKIVKNYALSDTYEELGIDVSGMELARIISGDNIQTGLDPLTRQVFSDQNGNFNAQSAVQFFTNAGQTEESKPVAMFLEEEMKDNRKYTKYISLISKGINVTSFEAKQMYIERTELVDFNYAVTKYNTIADSTISVSDSELEEYYDEHKDEYEQEHTRDIAYVTFNVIPSEADKKDTKEDLEYYKTDFTEISVDSTQEELISYVNANSETKFSYPHMTFEELNDSALFYASSDSVFGPVYENGSYVMKRVFDRVNIMDSVEARHILIQPDGQVIKDIDRAKEVADSLMSLIKSGSDFAEIAKNNSVYQVSAQNGGDLGMFTEAMIVNQLGLEFTDAVFSSRVGELKLIETNYGIHITEITGQGGKKTEKVRLALMTQAVRPGNNTVSEAFAVARDFSTNSNNSIEKYDELIEKSGYTKRIATDISPETEVIAGVENPGSVINWVFKNDTETESVSQAFQDGDMFIVAIITEIREEGIAPLEQIKEEISTKVIKEKKAEQFVKDMAGETNLVKNAKNMSFSSARLNDDGVEYSVITTAVYSEQDKVSEPIIGENGVYVVKVTSKTGGEVPEGIDLTNDKMNAQRRIDFRISREAFDAVKEAAEVIDNRHRFM